MSDWDFALSFRVKGAAASSNRTTVVAQNQHGIVSSDSRERVMLAVLEEYENGAQGKPASESIGEFNRFLSIDSMKQHFVCTRISSTKFPSKNE